MCRCCRRRRMFDFFGVIPAVAVMTPLTMAQLQCSTKSLGTWHQNNISWAHNNVSHAHKSG